jgi:hypothetical protein
MPPRNLVASPDPTSLPDAEDPSVLSYYALRKIVGWIATALPIVVFTITWIHRHCYQDSISAYYYTGMRNLFVGALCAIGLFLVASIGYKADRLASIIAGASAILVAFSPTTRPGCSNAPNTCALSTSLPFCYSPDIHGASAVILFLTLAYFCIVLFRKSGASVTDQKRKRNKIYFACGVIICLSMATFGLAELLKLAKAIDEIHPRNLLFFVETVCLFAFGFAWLVKGQQILADK